MVVRFVSFVVDFRFSFLLIILGKNDCLGQITVRMIAYLIMMAGSADFSTPIGYQVRKVVGVLFVDQPLNTCDFDCRRI